jgi:hypothetical protein
MTVSSAKDVCLPIIIVIRSNIDRNLRACRRWSFITSSDITIARVDGISPHYFLGRDTLLVYLFSVDLMSMKS